MKGDAEQAAFVVLRGTETQGDQAATDIEEEPWRLRMTTVRDVDNPDLSDLVGDVEVVGVAWGDGTGGGLDEPGHDGFEADGQAAGRDSGGKRIDQRWMCLGQS